MLKYLDVLKATHSYNPSKRPNEQGPPRSEHHVCTGSYSHTTSQGGILNMLLRNQIIVTEIYLLMLPLRTSLKELPKQTLQKMP